MTASPHERDLEIDPADAPERATTRLSVRTLKLTDFRNYGGARLDLDARPVVLVGENGSGKTNLLEAVSLLGAGHGLRGRPYAELARHEGQGGFAIAATVRTRHGELDIGTGLVPGVGEDSTGRTVRIAGKDRSAGALGDYVKHVFLIPAMDGLFTGGGSDRRRFLDRLVLAIAPGMRSSLNRYDRAMRQRNRLFQMREHSPSLFEGLEEQMAEAGVAIAAARLDAVERLSTLIEETRAAQGTAPFPHAAVVARHAGSGPRGCAPRPKPRMPSAFFWRNSGTGPRGGLDPRRASPERPARGPRPEECLGRHLLLWRAKALLAGPAFAKAELIKTLEGTALLVLLDEVAAHLDTRRRKALFDEIRGSSPGLDDRNRAELFRL